MYWNNGFGRDHREKIRLADTFGINSKPVICSKTDRTQHDTRTMRLGRHEKAILSALKTFHDVDMEWTWRPGDGLGRLADPEHVAEYKKGNIVPLWILRRDVKCGKTVLARALKTLAAKGLIRLLDGTLDTPFEPLSRYAKHVEITREGLRVVLAKTAKRQS